MIIKAVKFRKDGFYSQPFAFGGEEGMEKFDPNVRYRGSLQNYLIDTGNEVILVDTGLPAGTPEEKPDEKKPRFHRQRYLQLHGSFRRPRLQAGTGDEDPADPQTR